MPPTTASASVTAGLKCAPEMGPKVRMSATSAPPVAIVLASNATATFPPARRSPMMPDPMTVASKSVVPRPSAPNLRMRSGRACGGVAPPECLAASAAIAFTFCRDVLRAASSPALELRERGLVLAALRGERGVQALDQLPVEARGWRSELGEAPLPPPPVEDGPGPAQVREGPRRRRLRDVEHRDQVSNAERAIPKQMKDAHARGIPHRAKHPLDRQRVLGFADRRL